MAEVKERPTTLTEVQQQELDLAFEKARKALAIIETYDQERVDRLCQAAFWRPAAGGGVPGKIHPQGGHLQPPDPLH